MNEALEPNFEREKIGSGNSTPIKQTAKIFGKMPSEREKRESFRIYLTSHRERSR